MIDDGALDSSLEACITNVCQPGRNLLAAGYCLYSSCHTFVLTVGDGVYGFTLDPYVGEFVLTHNRIQVCKAAKGRDCDPCGARCLREEYRTAAQSAKCDRMLSCRPCLPGSSHPLHPAAGAASASARPLRCADNDACNYHCAPTVPLQVPEVGKVYPDRQLFCIKLVCVCAMD
jgi:hypothetical protein